MRIIIALDIIGGKCVRLTRGDFSTKKIYSENPLEVAIQLEDHGIKYLHLVDLDGALNKRITNHIILEKIATRTSLLIDFGGGIRSDEDLNTAFSCGANQVTCGSISVSNRQVMLGWLSKWGSEKIILGADSADRKVATEGWIENSGPDIFSFISDYCLSGIRYVICTDVEKDGMLQGPSIELYRELICIPGIKLIASGGISSLKNLEDLSMTGCDGAIIGKALYEGVLSLKEISQLC